MTKQINKTIRSLKRALKEINLIDIGDNDPTNLIPLDIKPSIEILIDNLEKEYQRIHKLKGKL